MTSLVRHARRESLRRALLLPVLALALAGGLVAGAPVAIRDVAAASPQLAITTDATYDVRPASHLVHVTLAAVATANTVDTVTTRYSFTSAYLQVLPGTSGYQASAGGRSLGVTVTSRTDQYTTLKIAFPSNLYSGQHLSFTVQFDLVDAGTTPARLVHVGQSFVSFPVWAFATANTAGSTVTVRFPAGFDVQQESGTIPGPTTDSAGNEIFRTGRLADPFSLFVWFTADRPGSFDTTAYSLPATGITSLQVEAWADDPAWGSQVGDLFNRGLPVIQQLIGLGKASISHLVVQEAASRTLSGYSGLFDPSTGTIEVAYYADPFVVLHEASHVWFNATLLSDRWIDEAFASYYATLAAAKLKLSVTGNPLTPALEQYRIQLNDWQGVGQEDPNVEDYAYAATLEVAQLIGDRAGQAGLQAVWRAIAAGEAAYQPPQGGPLETLTSPRADWRTLLDQLEQRTGKSYTDIWSQWVVSTSQQSLLADRAAALNDYATTVSAAGAWVLPRSIRSALGSWDFPTAESLMTQARAVITQANAISLRSKGLGIAPPPTLREDFSGSGGLAGASTEAASELRALDALEAAQAVSQRDGGFVGTIGLLGSHAPDDLAAARAAFTAGSLDEAIRLAASAEHDWSGAVPTGQQRLAIAAIVLAAAILGLLALRIVRRRRSSARLALAAVPAGARPPMVSPLEQAAGAGLPDGYGTLAGTPPDQAGLPDRAGSIGPTEPPADAPPPAEPLDDRAGREGGSDRP